MNRRDFLIRSGAAASMSLLAPVTSLAQSATTPATSVPVAQPPPVTEFKALRRNVGTFTGGGGTIGWLSNKETVAAIDTQFPNTAAIFLKDLPGRAGRTLDVTVNTHHHGDHTGGNAVFRPVTKSIVAQANVPGLMHARAEVDKKLVDPAMIPDTTFPETWKLDLGDETLSARYLGTGHTKGDIVVLFEKANVVHLGDLLFNRIYPVIDRPGGASVRHWVTVLETIHQEYPADAIYVSGHGNSKFGITLKRDELFVFRDYLSALLAYTEAGIKAGKSKDELQKTDNLAGFPDFFAVPGKGNRFPGNVATAYDELTAT